MKTLKKPVYGQLDTCYVCGSKIKKEGNSLHIWEITYECGCRIWGSLSDKKYIQVSRRCPQETENHSKV